VSYSPHRRDERRPAKLARYRGARALVSFHNGTTFTIPSKQLRELKVAPGQRFFLIITWVGREVSDIRAELPHPARPITPRGATPKIMVRSGRRLQTRKKPQ
jgi:hypothetical protein